MWMQLIKTGNTATRVALAIGFAAGVLASPGPAAGKVRVVATLPTLGSLVREIGGDRVGVEVLAAPGEDPHFVDPRPNLILSLNRADALVINGLELEAGWLPPLLQSARNGGIQVGSPGYLDASSVISRLDVPGGPVDRAQGDIHPGGNPHFLFEPESMSRIATAMAGLLSRVDPSGATIYAARGRELETRLNAAGREAAARVAALPPANRQVVAYHKSLTYLYRWLGLTEVTTIEPRPGIPPDPGHVAKVLSTMKTTGAKVILQEVFYPRSTSETLARLTGARLVVLPSGSEFDKGESVSDHVKEIADLVIRALSE
jgi:zinc/manganese transport system substrate-binding protein